MNTRHSNNTIKPGFCSTRSLLIVVALLCVVSTTLLAQDINAYKGNSLYRAKNVMSGNLVRSTFYNYGLVGNIGEISGEWPKGTGDEYVGDVSPLVGIEFVHPNGDTMHSVCTSDGPRGNSDGPSGGGAFWGFEPLPGFNAPAIVGQDPAVAMSDQKNTWPPFWPDKQITDSSDKLWKADLTDPGWRGSWNGYFGKNVSNADEETYYQMDDNADGQWFRRQDTLGHTFYYYPSQQDSTRRGLGLRVSVRGLQWAHFLAQDCIFWLYDITNISSYTYNKVCFGMVVGTLSGGRQDSQDDLAYFDLSNDITYSWDSDDHGSPGWVPVSSTHNVGYVGYAFLESPGNPYDGIDNDGDDTLGAPTAPVLTHSILTDMTTPHQVHAGDPIVLIDYYTYTRHDTTMPADVLVYFIEDVRKELREGSFVEEIPGNGIDDNLNGLIDEAYPTHLGLRYKDYLHGVGLNDWMIDEARDDGIDNDHDWSPLTDDVGADGVPGTGDVGEGDGRPTDGEPNFDKTDVHESDQIGLTSFVYFSPPGSIRMNDDNRLWTTMTPGVFDVVPNVPEDGDFIYGSGYFPLRPGQTERFSMALLYGEDFNDLQDNKQTVQQIYDENYNFARPPDKPTVWAVPGDGKVTVYWDDVAEKSLDPVSGYDFEGYKIYRSTDPEFNEVFTVTDGLGRKTFHKPIAQFDKKDSLTGFFPIIRNATSFYLGDDSGIEHNFVDNTVENGQRYFYAVCAYDHGDIPKKIFPAENPISVVVNAGGDIRFDINTVSATPRAPASGYEAPQLTSINHTSGFTTGAIAVEVLDPTKIDMTQSYEFTFTQIHDTINHTNLAYNIIRTRETQTDSIVKLKPLFAEDNLLPQSARFTSYYDSLFNMAPGSYDPTVYFKIAGTEIFDGQRAYMAIPRQATLINQNSGWADTSRHLFLYRFGVANYAAYYLTGTPYSSDYQVEFSSTIVDTAKYFNYFNLLVLPETPVKFRIKNLNNNQYIKFAFDEAPATTNGLVDNGEALLFFESDTVLTWALEFRSSPTTHDTTRPDAGDTLTLRLYQQFSDRDRFDYTVEPARINDGTIDLDKIKVYPNPYVAVSAQEPRNIFEEGRGERRLTFTHLPQSCTIRIYTVRGELVQTLRHRTTIDDGIENWDLRSKDGLNVAYGIYLYHVTVKDSKRGEENRKVCGDQMKKSTFSQICLTWPLVLMLLVAVTGQTLAQSKVGTTSASFLGIAVGARAVGMGGAFTAMANDPTALYWNPAGIAGMDQFSANFVHANWLADLNFDVVGAVIPMKDIGTLGAQVTLLSMPDQEVTTTTQGEQDGNGVFYSAGSMALQVSYARAFTDRFKLGLSGKYIREWIWHEDASTMAIDIGSLYTTPFHDMRIGFAISNFGGSMAMSGRDLNHYHDIDETRAGNNDRVLSAWSTDNWPLPLLMRVGVAMEFVNSKDHRLTGAIDALHPNDNTESVNLGAEYAWKEQFMLRTGYKSLFLKDSEEGLTLGAGVRIHTRGGPAFRFDFAYEDFGRLNSVYKYSLTVSY